MKKFNLTKMFRRNNPAASFIKSDVGLGVVNDLDLTDVDNLGRGITNVSINNGTGSGIKSYNAAKLDRLSADWISTKEDINAIIKNDKARVDTRIYDAQKNNPHVAGYLKRYITNVFGHKGLTFQANAKLPNGEQDDVANDIMENKFKEWCNAKYCSMNKRLTFRRVQWQVGTQIAMNGEFLTRVITNIDKKTNPFGISIQMLNPRNIDTQYNDDFESTFVVNGVHVNDWGEILGIWMRKQNMSYGKSYYNDRYFLPASEIIYDYNITEVSQLRGMSALASVLVTLKGLERWDDASLINAAVGASTMAFLYQEKADAANWLGSGRDVKNLSDEEKKKVEQEAKYGGKYMDMAAGIMQKVPYGWKVDHMDPKFPTEQHPAFNSTMLRKVATALGMNYNLSSGDLEAVNFSSIRQGAIDERDNWKMEQAFFIDSFLTPFGERWIDWTLMSGALKPLVDYIKLSTYQNHSWTTRSYDWVRPKEEVEAKALNVVSGFKSEIQIITEDGNDPEQIMRDKVKYNNLLKKYGLDKKEIEEKPPVETDPLDDNNVVVDDDSKPTNGKAKDLIVKNNGVN